MLENKKNMIKDIQDKTGTADSKLLAGGRGGGKDYDYKDYKTGNNTGKNESKTK